MIPENRVTTHPGLIALEMFAARLNLEPEQVLQLFAGERWVDKELAIALASDTCTSAQFWLNLQANHDKSKAAVGAPP